VGVVRGGDFLGGVGELADAAFHVGLAGGEPDVAGEDVGEADGGSGGFAGAGDGEVGGLGGGGEGGEVDYPASVGGSGGAYGLASEGDGDVFAGGGGAPDGEGFVALEDGVVAEEGGEGGVGAGGEGEGEREGEG